jgi:hypothetical protein
MEKRSLSNITNPPTQQEAVLSTSHTPEGDCILVLWYNVKRRAEMNIAEGGVAVNAPHG